MQTEFVFTWITLAIVSGALVIALAWLYKRQTEARQYLEAEVARMQQVINALTSSAVGVDKRIARLERQERELEYRQESLERNTDSERPYGDAIRAVRAGKGMDALENEYGLSKTEADLLLRMHGARETG